MNSFFIKIKHLMVLSILIASLCLCGCTKDEEAPKKWIEENIGVEGSEALSYAKLFSVDYCKDGYSFITINGDSYYLTIPSEQEIPQKLPDNITAIKLPLENIFVVGTGSMDFFVAADALDSVGFCSIEADEWEIDGIGSKMESNDIVYAGKYSAPDYEMLLANDCDFIVENTMITHAPEVLSQLQNLGFTAIVDHASLEPEVEGRMEWIKLYGLLTGKEEAAKRAFDEQVSLIEQSKSSAITDKKVAFFSITAAGTVTVRKNDDYVCNMISKAGGNYALKDLGGIDGTGSTTIQMESFYEQVKDCDILIYNSTIEGEIASIDDLVKKNSLLKNVKAVEDGNVYCTRGSFYQSAMELGSITRDFANIISGEDQLNYLVKLK